LAGRFVAVVAHFDSDRSRDRVGADF